MEGKKTYHTLDELYIGPFTTVRRFDENGSPRYVALERRLKPTGIYAADALLQSFARGESVLVHIARQMGCTARDLSGMMRCLTGMPSDDFRLAYRLRLADDLLRFTALPLAEVARRSGFGSAHNLHVAMRRHHQQTPDERRHKLRRPGDEGRFGVD